MRPEPSVRLAFSQPDHPRAESVAGASMILAARIRSLINERMEDGDLVWHKAGR